MEPVKLFWWDGICRGHRGAPCAGWISSFIISLSYLIVIIGGEENSMSTRLHRKSHCSSWIWPWRGDKIKKFFLMKNFQEDTESDLVAKKTGMWLCVKKSGSFVEWKLFQKKGNVVLWWSWGSFVDQPVRVTTEELPSHQTLHQLMKPFWKICQNKNILNVNNEIVLHPWDNLRNFPSGASFIEARPKKLERDCDCSLLHTCYSLHCCPQVLLSLILENLFPLVDCLLLFLPWADFILEKLQHPCYIPF